MKRLRPTITTYRSGATVWPFLVWALGASVGAYFAGRHALSLPTGSPTSWTFHALAAAAVLLGPISFGLHLARRFTGRVTLDAAQGLVLADGRLVRWNEIERIDHRPAPFGATAFLDPDEMEEARHIPGEVVTVTVLLRSILSIFYYLILPPLLIISPWHPRVTVRLIDGQHIVFRDLERDGEFVFRARKAITSGR